VNLHCSEALLIYRWPEDIIDIIRAMCSVHIQGNCQGTAKVFQLDYKSQDIMILLQMALSHSKSLLQG